MVATRCLATLTTSPSWPHSSPTETVVGLLSFNDILASMRELLSNVVQVAIDVLGLASNIINIIIFSQIGFTDSSTVVLFGLAVADLAFLFLSCVSQILDILDSTVGLRPFDPLRNLAYQTLWWYVLFNDAGILLTVFIAVQKCACVAIPLTFKSVFTTSRSVKITAFIYLGVFIYYLPLLASPGTWTRFDHACNWTRLYNYYYPNHTQAFSVVHIFSRVILPLVAQIVVIICMSVLIYKLREAQKMRRSMEQGRGPPQHGLTHNVKHNSSSRDIRAIQTVTLVSAIFVVCNMPDILITFTSQLYPEFGDARKYEGAFKLCSAIQDVLVVTNCAVNTFVYLKYNSKYRRKFQEIVQKMCRFRLWVNQHCSHRSKINCNLTIGACVCKDRIQPIHMLGSCQENRRQETTQNCLN